MSTMLPKNTAYPKHIATVPRVKLRDLNRLKSTMGCCSVISQISHAANAMTVMTVRVTMKGELNQSRSLPLSSRTCSAPTQMNNRNRPTRSMGSLRVGVSRDFKLVQQMNTQSTPTGTLMRKIHGH